MSATFDLESHLDRARAQEREACAALLDARAAELRARVESKSYRDTDEAGDWSYEAATLTNFARLIRARGQT